MVARRAERRGRRILSFFFLVGMSVRRSMIEMFSGAFVVEEE
jgi:hypothetical protein